MKKTLHGKLTLHRESLRHLEPQRLATVKGMSELCSATCLGGCTHSCRTPTCTC